MAREHSCGAILYTKENGEILYLIVTQSSGLHGFPKGHMEQGETEHGTAKREILEETGITVASFVDGFRMEETYDVVKKPGVDKLVTYFLAEFTGQEITVQESELRGAVLLPYPEAIALLERPERRQMLSAAQEKLLSL